MRNAAGQSERQAQTLVSASLVMCRMHDHVSAGAEKEGRYSIQTLSIAAWAASRRPVQPSSALMPLRIPVRLQKDPALRPTVTWISRS